MPKVMTLYYDDQALTIIAKVNKALAENGVSFSFMEMETDREGEMDFEIISNQPPRSGFSCVLDEYVVPGILSKYGPEGCSILATELRRAVQEDQSLSLADPARPATVQDMVDREVLQDLRKNGGSLWLAP